MVEPFLPLVTGDPAKKPATFSRFVLPFAYQPCRDPDRREGTAYRPTPDPWPDGKTETLGVERRDYLTPETASTLFERARWFRYDGDRQELTATFPGGPSVELRREPPRVVLFEAADVTPGTSPQRPKREEDPAALLRTGFLIIDLHFPENAGIGLSHLLEINELFRYWREPFPGHYGCKGVPRCLEAKDLYHCGAWREALDHPVLWDSTNARVGLFPSSWRGAAQTWMQRRGDEPAAARGEAPHELLDLGWIAFTDPRAYVWSCVVAEGGGDALRAAVHKPKAPPEDLGHWVALLNVDHPAHLTPSPFETKWAKEHTYDRWAEAGTFYGFASHSGVVLTPPLCEPPVWRQFATMHFDQTLLLLYLRVTTFRFSQRLSEISGEAVRAGWQSSGGFLQDFRRLRWAFALFTNLYQFPLLSSQQQGIEMYGKARKHMDVDALFGEVQQEIQTTEEYLDGVVQGEQTDAQVVLSVVATVGLALALALSWLQVRPGGSAARYTEGDAWMSGWAAVSALGFAFLLLMSIWVFRRLNRIFESLSGRRRKR